MGAAIPYGRLHWFACDNITEVNTQTDKCLPGTCTEHVVQGAKADAEPRGPISPTLLGLGGELRS